MARLLVVTEKSFGGEVWANTHCVVTQNESDGFVTDLDMTTLGAGSAFTTANTAGGTGTNFLMRLLDFERRLLDAQASITRLYITDGLRNLITTPDYLWSTSLSLPGVATYTGRAAGVALAPGTNPLVINRTAAGFSSRGGRMFVRGLLQYTDVKFNLRGGVDWFSAAVAANYSALVTAAIAGSTINNHIGAGTNVATVFYAIPHYQSKRTATPAIPRGTLVGATPIASIVMGAPHARQMFRGKKRKAAVAVL